MGLQSDLRAIAKDIIGQFGEDVLYRQFSDPEPLPGGAGVTREEEDFTLKAFLYDYETTDIDGTMVQQSDSAALFYTEDFVPRKNDELYMDASEEGERMMVINVTRHRVEGGDVLYELQVRG